MSPRFSLQPGAARGSGSSSSCCSTTRGSVAGRDTLATAATELSQSNAKNAQKAENKQQEDSQPRGFARWDLLTFRALLLHASATCSVSHTHKAAWPRLFAERARFCCVNTDAVTMQSVAPCITPSARHKTSIALRWLKFRAETFPDKWKMNVLTQMDKRASGNDRQTALQDRNVMHDQLFQLEQSVFFILPSTLLGRWVQQLEKRDARVSDKLIKLSLLSIICIVKKRSLIVFAEPDKNQEKRLHIFSVLSLFLILIQREHYTFMGLIKSKVLEASQLLVLVHRCMHRKKYWCEIQGLKGMREALKQISRLPR